MATNLFDALDNFVSCLHCNKTYQSPKRLPCSHIYCKDCLIQIISESNNSGEFKCPTCQMEVLVSLVDDIPDVPALANFIQALDKIKSLSLNQSPRCLLCKVVNSTTDAESFCVECLSTLCQECVPRHTYFADTHTNLLPCQNLEPHHVEKIMKNRTSVCLEHKKTMDIFCNTCDKLICSTCGSFEHGSHTKQPIVTLGDTIRTKLSEYVQKLHTREDDYEQYSTEADNSKTDYIKQAQTTKDQLSEHGEKLIQGIKQFLEESNETIDAETIKICKEIDFLKETLTVEKSRLAYLATYISNMVIYGNQDDVTTTSHDAGFYDTFLHEHQPTHTIPSLDVDLQLMEPDQFQFTYIGMLHYKVKPGKMAANLVSKHGLQYYPSAVASTMNNNIVTSQHDGSNVEIFNLDGTKIKSMPVPSGTQAGGVSCSRINVYITDKKTQSVLMFDIQGQYIKSLPVGFQGYGFIAISGSKMYVTSRNDHKVYRLDLPDGGNKTVFLQQKDGIDMPWGVAAGSTRVAITSYDKHIVQVYNTAGKLIFTHGEHGKAGGKPGQLHFPRGVALDYAGRVIISDYYNHRILMLSSKGEPLGEILMKKDSLASPQGINLSNDGNILVSCASPHHFAVYQYRFQ